MIFDKLEQFEQVISQIGPKVSLDTFFEAVGECVDEMIITEVSEKNVFFLGGETSFRLSRDEEEILVKAEIYYVDRNRQAAKQEFKGRSYLCNLNNLAQERFLEMLDENGVICMEIEEPQ